MKRWIKSNIFSFGKLYDALVTFFSHANST
jgi:hypothetical protein